MKKLILFFSVLAFALTANVFAQVNDNVEVSAEVNAALALTPSNVSFGSIQANQSSYIQANSNDGTAESNLGTDASAGSLQIVGSDGVDVTVSWTNAILTDTGGINPVTFTPTVYLGENLISSGDADVTLAGGDITLNIGGSLDAIANTGTYNTTNDNGEAAVFTVQYTSI